MLPMPLDIVGGAIVRQRFTVMRGGAPVSLAPGARLSREEVLAMANHRSLISSGRLTVFPKDPALASAAGADTPRHVVMRSPGKFDVIAGHKLNDRPLTKDEAVDLAGQRVD